MIAGVSEIRSHFPALERVHKRLPVAYFDAPGGTQIPWQVAHAMSQYLIEHNANTHWAYPTSEETDALIAEGRQAMAELLNCSPSEISFGVNMTTLTFHLARALGRTWSRGDEVIVTDLDHHGNVAPWRALEVDRGIVVRSVRMLREAAQLDLVHLEQLVGPKTRLLAIGAASNALGTINDLVRIAEIARSAKALLFVDAVHLAPHELIDVQSIGCDFLACSAYKFYGPHLGILFGRQALLESLPFPKVEPAPDTAPERAETGTQNQEGIAALPVVIDFLAALAGERGSRRERLAQTFVALRARGERQTRLLWEGLSAIPKVQLHGPPPTLPRTPTVSFTMRGRPSIDVARALAERAIFASHGDFYAATVVQMLGVAEQGLLRLGCACYTADDEVMRVVEEVRRIAAMGSGLEI